MKILHITTNYPTLSHPVFGIFMKEQVDSLVKKGLTCDVFFSNGKENGGPKQHLKSIFKVGNILRHTKYDIIHCHHSISGLILLLSGWGLIKKSVLSYQNDPTKEFGGKILFWILYPFFNKIIVKNKSHYLKYKKVIYLPNGVNSDFFIPMDKNECMEKLGWNKGMHYILYMDSNKGTRTQKRHDRYEAVLSLLKHKYENVVSVELHNTPREEIPIYMNACDLHLMTSDFEGSPNSVKECLCCNTPVVSTDVGNVYDMIGNIPGCYVDKTFSVERLFEYTMKVLESKEMFYGREIFLAKGYGIEIVAKKLIKIYNELC